MLAYSTFLGGSRDDRGEGIAIDGAGNAYVTGSTRSSNFPTTSGAFDSTLDGTVDSFVSKLDSVGAALVYTTYLGGSDVDTGTGIAIDTAGNAYVTGLTASADFPTTPGAFQQTYGLNQDAFVAKLDASGAALTYSAYLGGVGNDFGFAITVDAGGNAYVTGMTLSNDFPTTPGAFDTTFAEFTGLAAFVTKVDASGAALVYSTYLGGGGPAPDGTADNSGSGIVVDSAGNAYVTGATESAQFPTTPGAFGATHGGAMDSFVTKLDASGAALVYSTYLGGGGADAGDAIAVDDSGHAYVTGSTISINFPTTPGAFATTLGGPAQTDAFVTKLDVGGTALAYSTYLGGGHNEFGSGIAVDTGGTAYVTGYTQSGDFPTTPGAFDRTFGGLRDAFVTTIDPRAPRSAIPRILVGDVIIGAWESLSTAPGTSMQPDSLRRLVSRPRQAPLTEHLLAGTFSRPTSSWSRSRRRQSRSRRDGAQQPAGRPRPRRGILRHRHR